MGEEKGIAERVVAAKNRERVSRGGLPMSDAEMNAVLADVFGKWVLKEGPTHMAQACVNRPNRRFVRQQPLA